MSLGNVLNFALRMDEPAWDVFARIRSDLMDAGEFEARALAFQREMDAYLNQESEFDK